MLVLKIKKAARFLYAASLFLKVIYFNLNAFLTLAT